METTMHFFGYGVLSDPGVVAALLGKTEKYLVKTEVTLDGYSLAVQRLKQIPETLIPGTEFTARGLLQKVWGYQFISYVLVPNPGGKVVGFAWKVTREELDRFNDWEITEGDWHKEGEGTARANDGTEITVKVAQIGEGQEFDMIEDASDYKPWLSGTREEFVEAASNAYLEFNSRLISPEGINSNPTNIEIMRR